MKKVKTSVHRIQYYVRKVAQHGAIHPTKPRPRAHTYRHQRLLAYKAEMHRRIEKEKAHLGA